MLRLDGEALDRHITGNWGWAYEQPELDTPARQRCEKCRRQRPGVLCHVSGTSVLRHLVAAVAADDFQHDMDMEELETRDDRLARFALEKHAEWVKSVPGLGRAYGIYRLLNQTKIWTDRQGNKHLVAEMDAGYRQNVCHFLLCRAQTLFFGYLMGEGVHEGFQDIVFGAPDDFDIPSVMDAMPVVPTTEDYERWLRGTELFRALEEARS